MRMPRPGFRFFSPFFSLVLTTAGYMTQVLMEFYDYRTNGEFKCYKYTPKFEGRCRHPFAYTQIQKKKEKRKKKKEKDKKEKDTSGAKWTEI